MNTKDSIWLPLLIVGVLLAEFIYYVIKGYRGSEPKDNKLSLENDKPFLIIPAWCHYIWRGLFCLSILGIFYQLFGRINGEDNKIIFACVLVLIVLVGNLLYLTSLSGSQQTNYLFEIKNLLEDSADQRGFNQSQLQLKIRFKKWIITLVFSFLFFVAVIVYFLGFSQF